MEDVTGFFQSDPGTKTPSHFKYSLLDVKNEAVGDVVDKEKGVELRCANSLISSVT